MGQEKNSLILQDHIRVFFDKSTNDTTRQKALERICNSAFAGITNGFQLSRLIDQLTRHLSDEQLRSDCALLLGQLYLGKFAEGKLSPAGIMAPNRAHTAAYYFQLGMQYGDTRCAMMFSEAFKEK